MFTIKKLVLAAACVAIALGSSTVAAEPQGAHLRVHIRGDAMMKAVDEAALGSSGGSGVEDDGNDDTSSGSSGEPDDDDETPTNEPTVEVLIDVQPTPSEEPTDKPTEKPFCSGEGEYTVSVEYAEGVYCVKGPACVADHSDGVCPGPQKGLPEGSRCGKVASDVYGCTLRPPETSVPDTGSSDSEEPENTNEPVDSADFCPGDGEYEMSVAGASGVFCISGQACVAGIADGSCPGPQKGLEYGSSCGLVGDEVYGCKANSPPASKHHKKAHSSKKEAHSKTKKSSKSKKKNAKAHSHRSKKAGTSGKKSTRKVDSSHQSKKAKTHIRTNRHRKEN